MGQRGDGFPEHVDEDGDVKIPYEIDHADTLGAGVSDLSDHSPCDCDPQHVKDLEHEMAHAVRRQAENSKWFTDNDYRSWLLVVYIQAKRCDERCLSEELLVQFETVLDEHGIIPD